MTEIKLPEWQCLRCGHVWTGRVPYAPRRCPNCKDSRWQEPPRRAARQEGAGHTLTRNHTPETENEV